MVYLGSCIALLIQLDSNRFAMKVIKSLSRRVKHLFSVCYSIKQNGNDVAPVS